MNWSDIWPPATITIFAWWFSTGLILLLVRLPQHRHLGLLIGFGAIAGLAGWGVVASAAHDTPTGVYCAFLCTLVIWGWHEASFLMGKITGPRPLACPENVTGWRRFGYAAATLIYHEVALFLTLLLIAALTWQSSNQTSLWIFALLFAMRLSAKFNIFLGVPNLTEEFFPAHLEHLKSYLPKKSMNWLMPISLLACLSLIALLGRELLATSAGEGAVTALTVFVTLTILGMIEHIFMITPLPDAALWRWAAPVAAAKTPPIEDLKPDKKQENA